MNYNRTLRLLFIITASFLIAGCSSLLKKDSDRLKEESGASENVDKSLTAVPDPAFSPSDSVLNGDTEFFGLSNSEKLDSTAALLDAAVMFQENGDNDSADKLFESALELIFDIDQSDPEIDTERFAQLKAELDQCYRSFLGDITELPAESSPGAVITGIGIAEGDLVVGEDVFEEREGISDTLALDSLLASVEKLPPVPLDQNKKVGKAIKFFQGKGRKVFEKWMERAEIYIPMMQQILHEEGLPEELVYLSMIESGFNPKAYSYAHAAGPWQFIRSTGRIFGLKIDWWYDERRDPYKSTYAACDYLKRLYTEYDDWYLALAAYNCGEGRVNRHIRRYKTKDYWKLKRLPRQTRNYVPTYLAAYTIMKDPGKYGFEEIVFRGMSVYDSVLVKECLDLNLVAEIIDTSYQSVKDLNPAIVRWCTPPTQDSIWLRVPTGTTDIFYEKVAGIPEDQKRSWVRHKVRTGETLSIIAQKYGTSMRAITDIKSNNIRNRHRIRAGKYLLIPVPPHKYSKGMAAADLNFEEEYVPDGRTKITYTVRKGDNLGLIAQRYRTTVNSLKRWNNLRGKKFIYPGQKLKIYVRDSYNAQTYATTNIKVTPNGKVHVVRSGESLWTISNIYKLSLAKLKELNGFTGRRAVIHPGDEIKLYDEGDSEQQAALVAQVDGNSAVSDTLWTGGSGGNSSDQQNKIHIVQRGESLWRIAQKYNLETNELKRINGLSGRAIVHPGDKIKLYGIVNNQETRKLSPKETSYHTVRSGDNLTFIASMYGMRVEDLEQINGLTKNSTLHPGDKIRLYSDKGGMPEFEIHTVRRGDTLWEIANSYGIGLNELKRFNGIHGSAVIKPGDKIRIPTKG